MRAFADLLDRLSLTASRNAKLTLMRDYFRDTPDPERGWALAALTGDLSFDAAKPAMIRKAVEARVEHGDARGLLGGHPSIVAGQRRWLVTGSAARGRARTTSRGRPASGSAARGRARTTSRDGHV